MYTLVAVGFTVFFGVLRLINFAHGEVFMFGGFAALAVSTICLSVGIDNAPLIIVLNVHRGHAALGRARRGPRARRLQAAAGHAAAAAAG
ncbi:MAG: hypothetical protein AB7U38_12710, partial [Hyphomicrobiales bacterium]